MRGMLKAGLVAYGVMENGLSAAFESTMSSGVGNSLKVLKSLLKT